MFSIEERDRFREQLLARAEADELQRADPPLAARLRPMLAELCA